MAGAGGARPPPLGQGHQLGRALELLFDALEHNPHALAIHQAIWNTLSLLDLPQHLVARYIEITRQSVFYLDPHVCMRCRYRSTELLWQCPHCHEWNTFVEERITPATDTETEIPAGLAPLKRPSALHGRAGEPASRTASPSSRRSALRSSTPTCWPKRRRRRHAGWDAVVERFGRTFVRPDGQFDRAGARRT